jgi:predicted N-acetyltransferase YhbS
MLEITAFEREHLPGVMDLFAAEKWSYAADQERTWRALTASGSITLVAVENEQIVGVVQTLSDGEVQAFLSILLVAAEHRHAGVGRALLREALTRTSGIRLDLISCADGFYQTLGFRPVSAFRLTRTDHAAEVTREPSTPSRLHEL